MRSYRMWTFDEGIPSVGFAVLLPAKDKQKLNAAAEYTNH